jgi:CheY-like chemotaxis protein
MEKKTILIVDDDMILRQMYGARLEAEGYKIIFAGNGEEALKLAKEQKPDALILDIMMPKINGIDVLKTLRADSNTKEIPVVVLTALIQQIEEIKKVIGPKDSYLTKSETVPAEVVEKVQAALK